MTEGNGGKGGAVLSQLTKLQTKNLRISNSKAKEAGGAASIDGPSNVSYRRCVLEDSAAGGKG